ncbi:hypothetical protein [Lysinibacillus endophyticus]|uniref:hypothetical protein n=1 Tax=Ureibacillus endophyticus TaxID=1978490 RepID=UPI00209E1EE0|nr:hypothetical protein [Lysinibacillus endophyticus]MCP1146162.1 hypothetical protein [Lysinibacillus endophyticus]
MELRTRYKLHDLEDARYYLEARSHYYKVSEGKKVYMNSKLEGGKDDSILVEIGNGTYQFNLTLGAEDGERFALALLNLCHAIRF